MSEGTTEKAEPAIKVYDELDIHNGEPLRPTVVDGNGVERIVGPPVEAWQPAQVEPTQAQLDRNAAFHEREAARRDEATALLGQTTEEQLGITETPAAPVVETPATPVVETPAPVVTTGEEPAV